MLEVYVQYMKWAKDAFPTSPNKFHKLFEVANTLHAPSQRFAVVLSPRRTVDLKDWRELKNGTVPSFCGSNM
jgi:hypothetical protein